MGIKSKPNKYISKGDVFWIEMYRNDGSISGWTVISPEDVGLCKKYKWYMTGQKYPATNVEGIHTRMHQIIMGTRKGVDHIDGDPLNNLRSNLRLCNRSQNGANRKTESGGSSIYKGVCKKRNKWRASIGVRGKRYELGLFETEEEAAMAYNNAALQYHGSFARLNKVLTAECGHYNTLNYFPNIFSTQAEGNDNKDKK